MKIKFRLAECSFLPTIIRSSFLFLIAHSAFAQFDNDTIELWSFEGGGTYESESELRAAIASKFDADSVWHYSGDGENLVYAYSTGYVFYNSTFLNCFVGRNTGGPQFATIAETIDEAKTRSFDNCQANPAFCPAILSLSASGTPGRNSQLISASVTRTQFAGDCGGELGSNSSEDSIFVRTVFVNVTKTTVTPQQCESRTDNPINMYSGYKYHTQTDYSAAGAFPLSFKRSYNSLGNTGGSAPNWRHNYEIELKANFTTLPPSPAENPSTIVLKKADGESQVHQFVNGVYEPTDGSKSTVTRLEASHPMAPGFQVVNAANEIEFYDINGKPQKITSPSGLSHTFAYDRFRPDRLLSITDDFGKSLEFTYSNFLMLSMTDPDGNTYHYTYNDDDLLETVTYPDLTPGDDTDNPKIIYSYENIDFPTALTSVMDENGDVYLSYEYDEFGRAISSELGMGVGRTEVAYDLVNDTRILTNSLGLETVIQLDSRGFVSGVDRLASASGLCPAAAQSSSYDPNGHKTSTTDWNGNVTNFTYDVNGRELSRTEAVGTADQRTISTTWDPVFRQPSQIVEPGRTTSFTYDSIGSLLSMTETDTTTNTVPYSTNGRTRTTSYTYYPEGVQGEFLVATIDGPRTDVSDVTTYTYTPEGFVESITNPLGHVTQITSYNSRGLPLTVIDSNNVTTNFTYHPRGWLLSTTVIDPSGSPNSVSTNEYDAAGQLLKATLPNGSFLNYEYDSAHRLTAVVNNLGERTEFSLDNAGNTTVQNIRAGNNVITQTRMRVFDELSRVFQIVGGANQLVQMGYDDNGNETSRILDPLGINQVTLQSYDALDRLTTVTDADNNTSSFAYDARDNLISVTDQRGLTTIYTYDGLNNLIQLDSPDTGITVYTYDDLGNQISQTDARGVVTNNSYDALNRLASVSYPASPTENITYSYDNLAASFGTGRLTGIVDQTGSTSLAYDYRGNQLSSSVVIQGNNYTTTYSYDLADNLTQTVYPSGRIVNHQLDALGRTAAITTLQNAASVSNAIASNIDYLPFGPMNSLDYGNNLGLSISNDQDYRVSGINVTDNGGVNPAVLGLGYTQNAVDNITAITDTVDTNESQTFIYDLLNRLENATGDYGDQSFSYDPVGNRLSLTKTVEGVTSTETYTYDTGSNRLLSVDEDGVVRTLQYDSNGNIINDDRGSDPGFILEYDDQNRLIEVAPAGVQP